MNCEKALSLLSAAAMGDLDDSGGKIAENAENRDGKAAFEAHLHQCTSCCEEFKLTLQALNMAESLAILPSENLKNTIAANARLEITRQRSARNRWRYAISMSAAAASFLLGVILFFNKTPESEAVTTIEQAEQHTNTKKEFGTPNLPNLSNKDTQNWYFVDGDSGNTRQSRVEKLPVPEEILWKQEVGGRPGAYKPLLFKNLIIIGSSITKRGYRKGGRLIAFDVTTGKERWRRDFSSGDFYKDKSFPDRCILNNHLYITDGSQCLVLHLSTGKTVNRFVGPNLHTGWRYLSAVGGKLYGTSRNGRIVFCVSPETGSVHWQRTLDGEVYVPALNQKRMFVHTRTGSVVALDVTSGKTLWQQQHVTPIAQATLHTRGNRLLVVSRKSKILSFHTESGKLEWERQERGVFQSGMAMGKDLAYVKAGSLAISLADGKTFWQNTDAKNGICSAPTLAGQSEEVLTSAGQRHGQLNVLGRMGQIVASLDTSALWACDGPIISNGRVFLLGSGSLMAFGQKSQSVD